MAGLWVVVCSVSICLETGLEAVAELVGASLHFGGVSDPEGFLFEAA